ncbi:ArsR/SmtB family transcription factor [Salinimonas chungwhensis]|uniref:ArsR/SmtB family transcription factor n=1 Tax=Salinimonas chungwhensis TaxID=265425 RepID=UPI0003761F14|nr:metalloregulator ArsR/SmtB family transcription factor [Salinimonas chungwhensis]
MSATIETPNNDVISEYVNEAEQFFKLLANKTRLTVLYSLKDQELSVSDLLTRINVTQPVLSQHLALLREARVVATRREGQVIFYRLTDDRVLQTIRLMNAFFNESTD